MPSAIDAHPVLGREVSPNHTRKAREMDVRNVAGLKLLHEQAWTTSDARAQTRVFTAEELDELADFPWERPHWRRPPALRAMLASLLLGLRPAVAPRGPALPAPVGDSASAGS